MKIDDGDSRANCILEICCEPGAASQRAALVDELLAARVLETEAERKNQSTIGRVKVTRDEIADSVATWILERFDLAPKGSLTAFKKEIARLAKGPRHGGEA